MIRKMFVTTLVTIFGLTASAGVGSFDEWIHEKKSLSEAMGEKVVLLKSDIVREGNIAHEVFHAKDNEDYVLLVIADPDSTENVTLEAVDTDGTVVETVASTQVESHPTVKYAFTGAGGPVSFRAVAEKSPWSDSEEDSKVYFVVFER